MGKPELGGWITEGRLLYTFSSFLVFQHVTVYSTSKLKKQENQTTLKKKDTQPSPCLGRERERGTTPVPGEKAA